MTDRRLLAPAFPDDTGEADPALAAALATHHADPGVATLGAALAALAGARLLVPVVAVAGEVGDDGRDKTSDMAAVLLERPGGDRGLLAFTSTATLAAWRPDARPVPVTARTAALAAVQDGATALLVDLAGPARLVVDGGHLTGLAAGWRPVRAGPDLAWLDPDRQDPPHHHSQDRPQVRPQVRPQD